MQIYIRALVDGRYVLCAIDAVPGETIKDIVDKLRAHPKGKSARTPIKLTYGGRLLTENQRLQACEIVDNSILYQID